MAAFLLSLAACECGAHYTSPTRCPPNYVTRLPGATSADECVCPPGHFVSANATCAACPGGFVCPWNATALPVPCAPGTYCPPRSLESAPCPAGFVCGMTADSPTRCDAQLYCPEGSKQQQPCPPGAVCSSLGAACALGGVVPNCTQLCANCSCGDGFVAYNASCHNLSAACPPHLDCARRNALGVAPCVAGYELREGICAQAPTGWATPAAVAGIAVAATLAVVAAGSAAAAPVAAGQNVIAERIILNKRE